MVPSLILGYTRKQGDKARKSRPGSNVTLWSLLQSLHQASPTMNFEPNKQSPSQVEFSHRIGVQRRFLGLWVGRSVTVLSKRMEKLSKSRELGLGAVPATPATWKAEVDCLSAVV